MPWKKIGRREMNHSEEEFIQMVQNDYSGHVKVEILFDVRNEKRLGGSGMTDLLPAPKKAALGVHCDIAPGRLRSAESLGYRRMFKSDRQPCRAQMTGSSNVKSNEPRTQYGSLCSLSRASL
jgi:hypothetical protein